MTGDDLRTRIEDGLADEVHRMLDDKVVSAAEDIDLCLILGAGFPFQMGGVTPYLDRVGASERVFNDTFHHPVIRGTE
ncbi:MAG: fadB, partial [Glaciihabitans sp.]|nr:fadB [Glaciihabitans sp.]